MDIDKSNYSGDLSSFERQLAEWRPDSKGLHTDRMLYAAGLAAAKRGQQTTLWPALCLCLTLVSAASLGWGLIEHSEKQTLASLIHESTLHPNNALASVTPALSTYSPAANDYFHLRKQMEQHPGEWLVSSQQIDPQSPELAPLKPNIPQAGQLDRWRDQ